MARSLYYVFPGANIQDVCLAQAVGADGNLVLNGYLSNEINREVSFLARGYSRSLAIFSNEDLSAVTFTINGIQNGITVTEGITGPAEDQTVFSAKIYDVITSITVDEEINYVAIGSGYLGFFAIGVNLGKDIPVYALQLSAESDIQIPVEVSYTLYQIENLETYLEFVDSPRNIVVRAEAPLDDYIFGSKDVPVCRYILVQITGTEETINDSISMSFIQTQ